MKKLNKKNRTNEVTETTEVTNATETAENATERKPKRKGKKRYIVIGAAALVVIIGAVNSGGSKDASEAPSPTETVSEVSEPRYEAELDAIVGPSHILNDTTGNWRLSYSTKGTPPSEYAVEYYERYMNDGEIHYIWCIPLGTMTSIQKMSDTLLWVRSREYVEDEELDAHTIGGGMLLVEETINIETGEVEQLN